MVQKIKGLVLGLAAFLPLATFAQGVTYVRNQGAFRSIGGAFEQIIAIGNNYIIPFVIGLGVIYFLWGLLSYIRKTGDEAERQKARSQTIYGIIILFVMTAVWGLVNVLTDTLNLKKEIPNLPDVPVSNPRDSVNNQ